MMRDNPTLRDNMPFLNIIVTKRLHSPPRNSFDYLNRKGYCVNAAANAQLSETWQSLTLCPTSWATVWLIRGHFFIVLDFKSNLISPGIGYCGGFRVHSLLENCFLRLKGMCDHHIWLLWEQMYGNKLSLARARGFRTAGINQGKFKTL